MMNEKRKARFNRRDFTLDQRYKADNDKVNDVAFTQPANSLSILLSLSLIIKRPRVSPAKRAELKSSDFAPVWKYDPMMLRPFPRK